MKSNLYPVGPINQFEGDITILDNIYFIADCDIETKKDLEHPYLQIHGKVDSSIRTLSPNGKFSMKIHSPEYFNALKDYNIIIKNVRTLIYIEFQFEIIAIGNIIVVNNIK